MNAYFRIFSKFSVEVFRSSSWTASKDFDHRVPDAVNGITTTTTASSSRVMGSHCLIPERGSSKA
ncbi:hypothetical protein B0H19DRAFT_1133833, partial [Mycena capillaripes]